MKMTIGFIGAGMTGTALATRLWQRGYPVVAVSSRSLDSARRLASFVRGCMVCDSPQQVAELLGVTPDAIDGWVRRGWLGGERLLEGRLVIGEGAVARFLKEQGIDIEELFVKSVMKEGGARMPGSAASR